MGCSEIMICHTKATPIWHQIVKKIPWAARFDLKSRWLSGKGCQLEDISLEDRSIE